MVFSLIIWPRRIDSFVLQMLNPYSCLSRHLQALSMYLQYSERYSSSPYKRNLIRHPLLLNIRFQLWFLQTFLSFVSLIFLHLDSQMVNFSWDLAFCVSNGCSGHLFPIPVTRRPTIFCRRGYQHLAKNDVLYEFERAQKHSPFIVNRESYLLVQTRYYVRVKD